MIAKLTLHRGGCTVSVSHPALRKALAMEITYDDAAQTVTIDRESWEQTLQLLQTANDLIDAHEALGRELSDRLSAASSDVLTLVTDAAFHRVLDVARWQQATRIVIASTQDAETDTGRGMTRTAREIFGIEE